MSFSGLQKIFPVEDAEYKFKEGDIVRWFPANLPQYENLKFVIKSKHTSFHGTACYMIEQLDDPSGQLNVDEDDVDIDVGETLKSIRKANANY